MEYFKKNISWGPFNKEDCLFSIFYEVLPNRRHVYKAVCLDNGEISPKVFKTYKEAKCALLRWGAAIVKQPTIKASNYKIT